MAFGKIRKFARKAARSTYDTSGLSRAARGVRRNVNKADRAIFGGKGLRSNVRALKRELGRARSRRY